MSLIWLILVSVGLLSLVGVVWSLRQIWQERYSQHSQRFEKRLHDVTAMSAAGQEITNRERQFSRLPWLHQRLMHWSWAERIDRKLSKAGVTWVVADFLLATTFMALVGLGIFTFFGASFAVSLIGMALIGALPYLLLTLLERRRQMKLESQLPDVLEFIARSMQAGHAFSSALQMAASESPEPIGSEFQTAFNQVNLGLPVQQALTGLAERIDCADMRYFSVAVLINREVGGDLAGLLRNVADLIRTRLKLRLSIRALTAEGRMSAWILGTLPFILGALLLVLNPDYIAPLWQDPVGQRLVLYVLVLMGVGILWMSRISRVKV